MTSLSTNTDILFKGCNLIRSKDSLTNALLNLIRSKVGLINSPFKSEIHNSQLTIPLQNFGTMLKNSMVFCFPVSLIL